MCFAASPQPLARIFMGQWQLRGSTDSCSPRGNQGQWGAGGSCCPPPPCNPSPTGIGSPLPPDLQCQDFIFQPPVFQFQGQQCRIQAPHAGARGLCWRSQECLSCHLWSQRFCWGMKDWRLPILLPRRSLVGPFSSSMASIWSWSSWSRMSGSCPPARR